MGAGLILSLLTGPAFFSLVRTSIEKGFKSGAAFALGVFFSDAFYISLTFLGSRVIGIAEEYKLYIAGVGGIFLIAIGLRYLLKKTTIQLDAGTEVKKMKQTGYFIKGFLMNFLNPGMFFYWLGVATVLSGNTDTSSQDIAVFLGSTLFTVLSLDLTKAYISSRLRHMFSEKVIRWMNRIVGSALIIFAFAMIARIIAS